VSNRSQDLEMFAVYDPRVSALNDLRAARTRREAQWATWQMDRSWPHRWGAPTPIERVLDRAPQRKDLPWIFASALFVALGVVGAGLLTVGIEKGLL
jgi:hypothetical protein